jgi:hypothetical protein
LGGKHYRLAIILNVLVGYNDFVRVENIDKQGKESIELLATHQTKRVNFLDSTLKA